MCKKLEEKLAYHYTKGVYAIWEEVEGFNISNVSVITGRGTVVTSTSAIPCAFKLNDLVLIYTDTEVVESIITGIQIGKNTYDDVADGTENVSLLLRGIEKDQIKSGDVFVLKPIS